MGGGARSFDILIVGGGQAARRAAEGARAAAPGASIAILGEEPHAPYERPPLSKAVLEAGGGAEVCEPRPRESYAADRIELRLGRRARRIERAARIVLDEDGTRWGYGRLILATGSRPKRLPVPDSVADRVLSLRTREDAERLAARLVPGARLAVVGAGFIGLEVASSARARGVEVVVLEAAARALGRTLPEAVADRLVALHRAAGVEVRLGVGDLALAAGEAGTVRIDTRDGRLVADTVVVGIGVTPNVELAAEAGLAVADGIVVDECGATDDSAVFAAGEVTRHPVPGAGAPLRLESWQVAQLQSEAVGRSAAGAPTAHAAIPWFWTDQLGSNLQALGHVGPEDDLVVRDYPDGGSVWFSLGAGGGLKGVIAFDAGRDIAAARRLIAAGARPQAAALADPALPLRRMLGPGEAAGA